MASIFTRRYSLDSPGTGSAPIGGHTGDVLTKKSDTDGDTEWAAPHYVPDGGSSGYALVKASGDDYDLEWIDPASWFTALTTSDINAIIATIE